MSARLPRISRIGKSRYRDGFVTPDESKCPARRIFCRFFSLKTVFGTAVASLLGENRKTNSPVKPGKKKEDQK